MNRKSVMYSMIQEHFGQEYRKGSKNEGVGYEKIGASLRLPATTSGAMQTSK
jgi:hypothetical protein